MPQAYENAGVSVEAGYEVVKRIKSHVARTDRLGVVSGIGGFGGLFDLASLNYKEPVLISGTDGVGTKLVIAKLMGKHDTIGVDCVAMCVNDVVAQGAQPLFFLDYIACGETAEMPGMYDEDEYDLAGFTVGCVERSKIVDGSAIAEGDALIGLPSTGVHSNGFSLVRKALFEQAGYTVETRLPELGDRTLGDVLLTPTKIYVKALMPLFEADLVHGVAHITGGGFIENVPRMLPEGLAARIELGSWPVPPIFDVIERAGDVDHMEMFNIFNMGIGMVVAVPADREDEVMNLLANAGEQGYRIGSVVARGSDDVELA